MQIKEFQNKISKIAPVESGMVLLAWSHIRDERQCLHNEIYIREELLSAGVSLACIEDVAGLSDDEVASALNQAVPLCGESAALMDWDKVLGTEVFLLDEKNAGTLAAKLYWEMTFGGLTLDEIQTMREEICTSSAAYAKCIVQKIISHGVGIKWMEYTLSSDAHITGNGWNTLFHYRTRF